MKNMKIKNFMPFMFFMVNCSFILAWKRPWPGYDFLCKSLFQTI
jgi:hypothetical protein